jgi:Tfp pilus assembly protein PilP
MFKYLGKVTEGDETRVFLAFAERNYVVKAGENIDNQYRVDAVTDHAITFTYLPLGAKQILSTAGGG